MATLQEDIQKQSAWIVQAFAEDGFKLDYSINSLLEIDRFCHLHMPDGKPKRGGRLSKNFGGIVFSISAYIAETIRRNIAGSQLITDDSDPEGEINFQVKFPNGTVCFPAQKMISRLRNGLEDGIYPYGFELTREFQSDEFDIAFWEIGKANAKPAKPWWKIW